MSDTANEQATMADGVDHGSDQSSDHSFDIVIIGAGIAGSVAASALGRLGISVALVDAQTPQVQAQDVAATNTPTYQGTSVDDFSPRVSALTPANVQWLERLGIWSALSKGQALPYTAMEVWEQLGGGRISFDALEYQRPALGHIVENPDLLSAALTTVQATETVRCFFGSKLTRCEFFKDSDRYQLSLENGASLNARLLVGADGANSYIRRLLNLPTREWDYEQEAIVCTVETERPHSNTAWQRFSESGPVAFLPLSDSLPSDDLRHGHFCSIVWSLDTSKAHAAFELSDAAFMSALGRELEDTLGAVKSVSKRFKFPLRQRHAKAYTKQQAVLVGDAAHTIHPLAGQGLNLGLSDVQALVSIVEQALAKGYDIAHPVLLQRYQRQRQGENLTMMASMEGFKRLFGTTNPMMRLIRNIGVDTINRHTLIKRQIATKAMGL